MTPTTAYAHDGLEGLSDDCRLVLDFLALDAESAPEFEIDARFVAKLTYAHALSSAKFAIKLRPLQAKIAELDAVLAGGEQLP